MNTKVVLLFIVAVISSVVVAAPSPKLRGESATAVFHFDHANGCTETDATVNVFNNEGYRVGDPPENAPYVEIVYKVFGQPTGEPASDPENCDGLYYYELSGSAPLADGDFDAAGGLQSAILDTTIQVWDEEAAIFFDLDVYVEWTATGKMVQKSRSASAVLDVSSTYLSPMYIVNPITTSDAAISRLH